MVISAVDARFRLRLYLVSRNEMMTMKRILLLLSLALMLAATGCNDLKYTASDYVFIPLTMTGPDGTMQLSASYVAKPSDVPGCSGVICHTSGKDVFTYLWLSFYFYDTTPIGYELQLERLDFGAMLSSDSHQYTNEFTGKMILSSRSDREVSIFMQDVHFKIAHGEYVLNGTLVAKK